MKSDEYILKCFSDRGMRIELGAQFSARGQIAQLLDGVKDVVGVCEWHEQSYDMEGTYDTGCGNLFTVGEGTPEENSFKYCAYCGGEIDATPVNYDDL